MNTKTIKLRPRKKYWGWCYRQCRRLHMTGKAWHEYAKLDTFKTDHGADSAWGNKCEVWFDNKTELTDSFTEVDPFAEIDEEDIHNTSLPDR